MKEVLDKIDSLLFDLLGLVVPGIFLLFLISLPGLVLPNDTSYLTNLTATLDGLLQFSKQNSTSFGLGFFLASYIFGHVIKVFSKFQYELFTEFFDKILWNWKTPLFAEKMLRWPVIGFLAKRIKGILSFSSENYYSGELYKRVLEMLEKRGWLIKDGRHDWYNVFRLSSVILAQGNVKSIAYFHLSRYNFYRSMAFLFFTNLIYDLWLAGITSTFGFLLFLVNCAGWYAFHEKYKRYWTLCGNETLISVFYHLAKSEKNGQ